MASDPQNQQYVQGAYGLGTNGEWASTGAPGSAPAPSAPLPASSADAPFVVGPYDTLALGKQVPAGSGDTMTNSQYQRPSAITPGSGADYSVPEFGQVSGPVVGHFNHPGTEGSA